MDRGSITSMGEKKNPFCHYCERGRSEKKKKTSLLSLLSKGEEKQ
jgi:hypothetical protein